MGNAFYLRTRILGAAAALAAGAVFATAAQAITIYAPDNLGPTNAGTTGDRIIRFDSSNPSGTVVTLGPTGVLNEGMAGMDFAGNGQLYSASGFNTSGGAFAGSKLYRVNTTNGAATLVGSMGLPTGDNVTDLSWNRVTQQMLALTYNGSISNLYNVNLNTGASSLIGQITGVPGSLDIGLASNSAGVNYVHDLVNDRMYVLAGTAATPLPSPTGVDSNFSQGMVINWQGNNEWFLGAIGSSPAFFSQIMLVNNATGAATTVPGGTWPIHAANGLPEYETGDLAIPVVPEPATAGFLAAGALAMFVRRRRA
jgi:hypothetical protein